MHGDEARNHLAGRQERARVSPVRARMLDLYGVDRSRSLDPQALADDLTAEGWKVSLAQVTYHLRKLQEAELVPTPCPGG